jgi:hypothetical protein
VPRRRARAPTAADGHGSKASKLEAALVLGGKQTGQHRQGGGEKLTVGLVVGELVAARGRGCGGLVRRGAASL